MKCNLDKLPELPTKPHLFFLAPRRNIELIDQAQRTVKKTLYYRDIGKGKPILLLHGLWSSAYSFRDLIEPLSPTYRLIMPELLNFENHDQSLHPNYQPEQLSELFKSICQALELEKPLVVAHGESGMAALLLAMEQPQLMSALITLCPCIYLKSRLRLKGRLMHGKWLRNRWAKKGFQNPQRMACSILDYSDPSFASRQEIRELAHGWTSLPMARLTSTILAQSLSSVYRQKFYRILSNFLSNGDSFSLPINIVMGKTALGLPRKVREKLTNSSKSLEFIKPPVATNTPQVESSDWLSEIIVTMASKK